MDKDLELLDRYLLGRLNEKELKLFEERLKNDLALQQSLDELTVIRSAIRRETKENVLDLLKEKEAIIQNKENRRLTFGMRRFLSVAAAILLIATVGYYVLFNNLSEPMTGEALYELYYDGPYLNIVGGTERGATELEETLEAKAYLAYDLGEYSEAITYFKELIDQNKTATNYFYAGVSSLELGDMEAAKIYFNVTANHFEEFREQAQWYMAMTLLKENRVNEAVSSLVYLNLNNTRYADKADEILGELEVPWKEDRETGTVEAGSIDPPEEDVFGLAKKNDKVRTTYHARVKTNNGKSYYEITSDYPLNLSPDDSIVFGILEEAKGEVPGRAYLIEVLGK